MSQHPIVIIGGGHMGGAMAARWHAANVSSIHIVERDAARRVALAAQGLRCHATLAEAPRGEVIVLAVKPQQFSELAPELRKVIAGTSPLLISIMAGITLTDLRTITPSVVRAMPNLPALIGESMSVLCTLPEVKGFACDEAEALFRHIGTVAWVKDEALLHAVTAISGSGPAYLFAFMEGLEQAALALGLDAALTQKLVTQTMVGAALLANQSSQDFTTLRNQVTSPGGTTEAALRVLHNGTLATLIAKATKAAADRSRELAKVTP